VQWQNGAVVDEKGSASSKDWSSIFWYFYLSRTPSPPSPPPLTDHKRHISHGYQSMRCECDGRGEGGVCGVLLLCDNVMREWRGCKQISFSNCAKVCGWGGGGCVRGVGGQGLKNRLGHDHVT
jgi:hypothetical protein